MLHRVIHANKMKSYLSIEGQSDLKGPRVVAKFLPSVLFDEMLCTKSTGPSAAYGSHVALLEKAVKKLGGPVLELGAGIFSSRALIANLGDAELLTLESNRLWYERISTEGIFNGRQHRLLYVEYWDQVNHLADSPWTIVFVDHAPRERRLTDIKRFANSCDLMVVHDTEEACYGFESVFSGFKYRLDFANEVPFTTCVSNKIDVRSFFAADTF